MIKLTENAKKELTAFFADKEKSTIRVFLASWWLTRSKIIFGSG